MVEYIRAWVIGAVAWFMLTNVGALVFHVLAPAEHTRSFGWALLWLGGIGFAAYFLSVVAAALVHRAPDRHRLSRNAIAVLAAPVVGTLADTVRLLFGTGINWSLYGSWTAVALAGAVLGFLLMRRLQSPTVVESSTGQRVRVPRTYWDRTEAAGAAESEDEGDEGDEEDAREGASEKAGREEAAADADPEADPEADPAADAGAQSDSAPERTEPVGDSGDTPSENSPAETGRTGS